ncbi:MAG: hypothetical protein QOI20_2077, partial [Acidimicrobiaceae bacterium]|nr:hypothetical protein [Acidimicrobiaceae bacterium]
DLDVVFILTTNRVEAIESAISARPGRVDHAVEIPVPDRDALGRLLDLYGEGIDLKLADREAVIARLEGVTASFVRELLRRATLLAARQAETSEPSDPSPLTLTVSDEHVHAALDRLLDPHSPLTAALLGRHQAPAVATATSSDSGPGAEWCALA